jgi:hypothetical protein
MDVADVFESHDRKDCAVMWFGSVPERMDLAKKLSCLTYVRRGQRPVITLQGDKDNLVPYQDGVRSTKSSIGPEFQTGSSPFLSADTEAGASKKIYLDNKRYPVSSGARGLIRVRKRINTFRVLDHVAPWNPKALGKGMRHPWRFDCPVSRI